MCQQTLRVSQGCSVSSDNQDRCFALHRMFVKHQKKELNSLHDNMPENTGMMTHNFSEKYGLVERQEF